VTIVPDAVVPGAADASTAVVAVVSGEVADVSAEVVTVGDADVVTVAAGSAPSSSSQVAATSAAVIRKISVFDQWREKRALWVLVMVSQVLPRSA
jgi:hypothetical protein